MEEEEATKTADKDAGSVKHFRKEDDAYAPPCDTHNANAVKELRQDRTTDFIGSPRLTQ